MFSEGVFENIVIDYDWVWISLGLLVFFVLVRLAIKYIRPWFVLPSSSISKFKKVLYNIFIYCTVIIILVLPLNIGFEQEAEYMDVETLDVQMLFNISLSMTSTDVKPSRWELSRKYMYKFVGQLDGYNTSIIIFSGIPFIYSPFSNHTSMVQAKVDNMDIGYFPPTFEFVGTAKGNAIFYAVENLLKHSENDTEPWVIVLFTDGESNKWYDPVKAAKYASNNNIPIFTFVVWKKDTVIWEDMYGTKVGTSFDLELVEDITKASGWDYFVIDSESDFQQWVDYVREYVTSQEKQYQWYEQVYINKYLYRFLAVMLMFISLVKISMYINLDK